MNGIRSFLGMRSHERSVLRARLENKIQHVLTKVFCEKTNPLASHNY